MATNRKVLHARVRHGGQQDNLSFEVLYRESYPLVYNYVRYQMLDDSLAQDIVSEAFLKAARAFTRFDPQRAKFSTWVITIAKNCMRDYYGRQRSTVSLDDEGVEPLVEPTYDTHPELDDTGQRLSKALATLSEADRELVFLKYYQGMKNRDIAKATGMNESTVSTKLSRAIARLRDILVEEP
ncbi:MAG: sigma-70 family RNA polymerase sigma factor [Atopobiaceae bacterium]|nr:sigma-70 family RNA polymerase sigma factor [Atopobiaceae bacterium]